MKQPWLLFTALLLATVSSAQLPDGSIAPDFTATDIDGVEHNLYDLLDEGKKVILEFGLECE
jgi:serine/threonine protein kinase HipA of HipAB toxin-antitoxin module